MIGTMEPAYDDDSVAMGVLGPIALTLWRGETTLERVHRTEELGDEALAASPRGAGLMFIALPSAKPPSGELRRLTARINERLVAKGAVGVAGVIPTRGFSGALYRGIVTSLSLLSGHSYPLRTFSDAREGTFWLCDLLQQRAGVVSSPIKLADDIDAFVRDYRRRTEQPSMSDLSAE